MSYRESTFTLCELKAVMLRDLYPEGNIHYLASYAHLWSGYEQYKISVQLPVDHWAFTQAEEPKPPYYVASERGVIEVVYRRSMCIIGKFTLFRDAKDYAEFLNNRLAAKS